MNHRCISCRDPSLMTIQSIDRFFQHRADDTDEKILETNVQSQTENLEKKIDSFAISSETAIVRKDEEPMTSASLKKRKSPGVFSCFGNKKAKASKGQPTIAASSANSPTIAQQTTTPIEEKPAIDYAILSDGKRVYIDAFRDRPGLDMSYKPDDFDNRFVLPPVRIHDDDDHHQSIHTVLYFCMVLSFHFYCFVPLPITPFFAYVCVCVFACFMIALKNH